MGIGEGGEDGQPKSWIVWAEIRTNWIYAIDAASHFDLCFYFGFLNPAPLKSAQLGLYIWQARCSSGFEQLMSQTGFSICLAFSSGRIPYSKPDPPLPTLSILKPTNQPTPDGPDRRLRQTAPFFRSRSDYLLWFHCSMDADGRTLFLEMEFRCDHAGQPG